MTDSRMGGRPPLEPLQRRLGFAGEPGGGCADVFEDFDGSIGLRLSFYFDHAVRIARRASEALASVVTRDSAIPSLKIRRILCAS